MQEQVKSRPDGFHTVTPYLVVNGAARLLEFLKQGLGAQVVGEPFKSPDGKIMHAAVRIGDSMVEIGDAPGEPMPSNLHVYVGDTDTAYRRAIDAGGTSLREPMTTFYGDRSAAVKDPCGNGWWFACHVEDVSPDEMARRMKAASPEPNR
jgi:uncharacterized glyoxalase superfamily protein PhnB